MKTSPFSTFTRMGVVDFASPTVSNGVNRPANSANQPTQETCDTKVQQSSSNQMRLLKALPVSWLLLMARDRELAPAFSFEPNQGLYPRLAQTRQQGQKFKQ